MKKALVVTALLTTCCAMAPAQVVLGVKAGAGLSKVMVMNVPANLDFEGYDYRFSIQGGATATQPISEKFSIAAELLYELKGTIFPASDVSEEAQLSLHYLSLPVLANYEFFQGFRIEVGPQIGYRLAADIDKLSNVAPFTAEDIYNVEWDVGLSGGIKYYAPYNLYLSARYTHGLSQVSNLKFTDANGEPYADIKLQNQAFQLSLGYEFKTGKK